MKKIVFEIGTVRIEGTLNSSNTAAKIYSTLPIKGKANLWGKEIYFSVPVHLPLEDGKEIVNIGDIAYWPEGPAVCIFFGPTPISRGDEIRPYSKVTLIGQVDGNFIKDLYNIKDGDKIEMKPLTSGGD
ncbi:MAG TPA: cyclophilin-like fold protein [bacterium]|nr:cyclophilin-like fold protein [bacterium]HOL50303.1 cyclophilin-like fold protein [bacterium]